MKTLEIHIPDDVLAKIEQYGVSVDEWIRVSVEEKLARDEEFERAAEHVLTKNAELYERLS